MELEKQEPYFQRLEGSLSKQEIHFLKIYKKVSCRKGKNLVPTELITHTGIAATFVKACIEVAIKTNKSIAAAAFITAIIDGETIRLPLLHSECTPIMSKVSKEQKVSPKIDKKERQISFASLDG